MLLLKGIFREKAIKLKVSIRWTLQELLRRCDTWWKTSSASRGSHRDWTEGISRVRHCQSIYHVLAPSTGSSLASPTALRILTLNRLTLTRKRHRVTKMGLRQSASARTKKAFPSYSAFNLRFSTCSPTRKIILDK